MGKSLKTGFLLFFLASVHLAVAQDTIVLNTFHSFEVLPQPNYNYQWWFENELGDKTYFNSKAGSTGNYFWANEGSFELFVQATDENGCLSEIISKTFVVDNFGNEKPLSITDDIFISILDVLAGRDTIIGGCDPYTLRGSLIGDEGFSYSWKPGVFLDDSTRATPVFSPGSTTVFEFTVTDYYGFSEIDSVEITVSNVMAEAGEDVYMYRNSSTVLDAGFSSGINLQYLWSTQNGIIENGETTPNPTVSGYGVYFLEVTDKFGCVAYDSVKVGMLTYAPVAQNDYDSTAYWAETIIQVLDNDYDPENDIDSLSLTVTLPPINGTAYVDYNHFTIHYQPNENFSGIDNFEYQICDTFNNCDRATVFVMVSEFNFFIPDAFSPNGDNINDYFEIIGIEWYEGNSIEIFNRWGNKVYQTQNYGISATPTFWDGKSNTGIRFGNEQLPTGTYFYILDLGNGEKRMAGSVYLDR